ncbi:MAG: hypothetical protein ABIW49_01840 [Knoellia sp.]
MWPWLMIAVGVLLVVGGLVARHRMLRDYQAQLAEEEASEAATQRVLTTTVERTARPESKPRPGPTPANAPTTTTEPEPLASIPFPDRPAAHRLTPPPMLRARSSDVPLLDWLRYYSDGNAWSGVIQSIADRISGDPMLQPWFGSMDRPTLQRHVMSLVMELTGEGLTVGTVRRLADAHVKFVAAGGDHVTEPVWDKMHATFANALREHLVPERAVLALDDTLAPLKAFIVTRSDANIDGA